MAHISSCVYFFLSSPSYQQCTVIVLVTVQYTVYFLVSLQVTLLLFLLFVILLVVLSPANVIHDFLCLRFSIIATLFNVTHSHGMYCTVCLTIHFGLLWPRVLKTVYL